MPKVVKSIQLYEEKCVGQRDHVIVHKISEKTFGEILDLAIINDCNIIVKSGKNGSWYLKQKEYAKTLDELDCPVKHFRKRHDCYIIKYVE
jgi:hypothetical protein